MKNSIFVDELKERSKGIKINKNIQENLVIQSYNNILKHNNVFITIVCVVLGSIGFCLMGYFLESHIKNGTWYLKSIIEILLAGISINIILWCLKSLMTYILWNIFIKKDYNVNIDPFLFFTIEGMSDIIFFVALPVFFIIYLINSYIGMLVLGGLVFIKYILMFISYPQLLPCKIIDRLIFIFSSLITLAFIKMIISFIL